MPNKIEIIITADNRARTEITRLNEQVRGLSDHLDQSGAAGQTSFRQVAAGAELAGSKMELAKVKVERLEHELTVASERYRTLTEADTKATDSEINSALIKVKELQARRQVMLDQLADVGRSAARAVPTPDAGNFAQLLRPQLAAVAIGSVPALVNAAVAAVLLGAGGTALAVGLRAAASSPEVKAAFGPLKTTAETEFAQIGEAFRKPAVESIGTLDKALKSLDLAGAIAPAAEAVKPLANGLAGLAENALPGIRDMIEESVPLLETVADHLPRIGDRISELGEAFAGAGDEANSTLHDVLSLTEVTIGAIANMVSVITTVSGAFRGVRDWLAEWYPAAQFARWAGGAEETTNHMVRLDDAAQSNAGSFADAARAAAGYADDLDRLTTSIRTAWGAQMGVDEATLAFSNSLLGLADAVEKNGKSLQFGTEAGNANRESLIRAADDAWALFEAEVALTGSVGAAGNKLNANLAQLEANAIKAGLNADQVRALLAQYRALASSPDINKNINIKTNYTTKGTPPRDASYANIPTGRVGGYSSGGRVRGGSGVRDDVLALLTGDEVVLSRRDVAALGGPDAVERWRTELHTPAVGPTAVSSVSGSGSAGGGGRVLLGSDGSRLGDLLVELIATAVRSAGSDPSVLGLATTR